MEKIIGICNLHDGPHLGSLTDHRPLGTVTLLGRYGLMDFTLSNFSNSAIDRVLILVENHVEAVRNHTGNGQVWIANTKTGMQKLIFNERGVKSPKFNTDVMNVLANKYAIQDTAGDYVVVAPPFFLMNCDYREMVDKHIASGKEISLMYKKIDNANEDFINCDTVKVEGGLVTSMGVNTGAKAKASISLETFIMKKTKFLEICEMTKDVSSIYTFRKMIGHIIENKIDEVNAIEFKDHVMPFLSFPGYVKNSMKLLKAEEAMKYFSTRSSIYTTVHSTAPTLYGPHAEVKNSYVANGCKIDGVVENSILSREVVIEKGASVKNCILFTRTVVRSGCSIENVVTDKRAEIKTEKNVKGDEDNYLFVYYGAKI